MFTLIHLKEITYNWNFSRRLVVVDHEVAAVAADGQGRTRLRPDQYVQRVPDTLVKVTIIKTVLI